jgi:hypothetical protein
MNETIVEIVGEVVAGEAAQTLKQVKALIKGLSSNTFDLAHALYKVKKNKYYAPKFLTFSEYAKDLDIRLSKCYYLIRITETMETVGLAREQYEGVGIAKLRAICRLDLTDENGHGKMYEGKPAVEVIKDLIAQAPAHSPEAVGETVKKLQGLVGEDSIVWINFPIKLAARNKWDEAISLAQKNIGSVGKDADGNYVDASVGSCAEVIAASYILDPNNSPEEGPNEQQETDVPSADSGAI